MKRLEVYIYNQACTGHPGIVSRLSSYIPIFENNEKTKNSIYSIGWHNHI